MLGIKIGTVRSRIHRGRTQLREALVHRAPSRWPHPVHRTDRGLMAHLGSDVAAFVDGQLSPAAMQAADAHLQRCDGCDRAVRQQRLMKSRMGTVVVAGAAGVAVRLLDRPGRRAAAGELVGARAALRAGSALAWCWRAPRWRSSAIAYAVGGSAAGVGDRVAPPFDEYAADFFGATSRATAASVSQDTVDQLTRDGWPCHPRLAGDLERTQAGYAHGADTIALTYSNGTTRMKLYEQTGWLDPAALDGFDRAGWDTSSVWVRPGSPTLVTWDEGGVVFTMVTDADSGRIRQAVARAADQRRADGHPHPGRPRPRPHDRPGSPPPDSPNFAVEHDSTSLRCVSPQNSGTGARWPRSRRVASRRGAGCGSP